jgi:hypothetical protein
LETKFENLSRKRNDYKETTNKEEAFNIAEVQEKSARRKEKKRTNKVQSNP